MRLPNKRYFYGVLGAIALLAIGLPLWGVLQSAAVIPSPEEAVKQAEKLAPEELAQIQIDEVTRDRLRFDPAWQPIVRAIRQDIMILKWGDNKLDNPVWQRYGAKAYPLLDYYARSGDPTRQIYGVVGIRKLGKPYTTLWLEQLLQRQPENFDIYLLTAKPESLLDPNQYTQPDPEAWKREFGLDDPAVRDRLVQLAQQNTKPAPQAEFERQFNRQFLRALLGDGAVDQPPPRAYFDPRQALNTSEWARLLQLQQANAEDIREAIALYDSLPTPSQKYLLVDVFAPSKAGEIIPIARSILQHIATQANSEHQAWAAAELDRHGDPQGSAILQNLINGDLSRLHNLTRNVYDGFFGQDLHQGAHAYYLLLGIVEKYPDSLFAKSCREYGDLTGYSYFGGEPRSKAILDRIAQKTPEQRAKDWEQWLARYPHHPGTDDATYHKARQLQAQGDIVGAMQLWINMMVQPMGDRDALYLAWPHVRTLLDVGLTTAQIQTLRDRSQNQSLAPLLQYALTVRYARDLDYANALQASEQLDLTQMPVEILQTYYKADPGYDGAVNDVAQKQQQMQAMLTEQRQRWQQLQQWQQQNTPESRYQMASNWAGEGGWKNGYLPVWDNFRTYRLPQNDCQTWWTCDYEKRNASEIRAAYQAASQNAIALSLYQDLLGDRATPASLREKTLYQVASTLLAQWEDYPYGETKRIHPLPGMTGELNTLIFSTSTIDSDWEAVERQMQQDYQQRLDEIIQEMQLTFPKSPYIDDLLFSSFYLSGERKYLNQILEQYPKGDRAAEAKFIRDRLSSQSGS